METKNRGFGYIRDFIRHDKHARGVLYSVVVMMAIGAYTIFSATFVADSIDNANGFNYILKHMAFLIVSILAGYVATISSHKIYKDKEKANYVHGLIFLGFVAVIIFGVPINGAQRWVSLGFISIQPSEFAKIASIIWAADRVSDNLRRYGKNYWISRDTAYPFINSAFWMPFFYAVFTYMQPDLGTAVIIFSFFLLMVIIGGASKKSIFILVGLIPLILVPLIWNSEYRLKRIYSWYDPWSYAGGDGYQAVQSILAVGSGGFGGQGIFQGTSKYFYLPEAHTDFAFAVFAQESGFVGSIFLLLAVVIFTYSALQIARYSSDYEGFFLGIGITFLISGQALYNMLMICGVLPVTGIPFPFISYGGSSLLTNSLAIGILLNIALQTARKKRSRKSNSL